MDWKWPLAALAAALCLTTAPAAFAAAPDPPASAGWHGREIRDPLPTPVLDAVARFPRGWSAGEVARGTGYANPDGSRRVREVQRRLIRRGYRPGPVDGRFGPRTRAAVMWFQVKHGLPRTGRVDARSIATLREDRVMKRVRATTPAPEPPTTAAQTAPAPTSETAIGGWWLLLPILVLACVVAAIVWSARGRAAHPAQPRPTALPTAVPNQVLGYVAVGHGEHRHRDLDASIRIIGSWCETRGWPLARVVHDVLPAGAGTSDRPGLAHVLDQIADGRVAGVVVARLGDLARSVDEAAGLLEWIDRAGGFLIAIDYDLASSTASGVEHEHPRPTAIRGRWDAP
jgi:hypothetical protein